MSSWHARGGFLFVAILLVAGGCDKELTLTFVNHTDRAQPVAVQLPGRAQRDLGTIAANGGEVRHAFKMEDDDLPADVTCTAGASQLHLRITEESPDDQAHVFWLIDPTRAAPTDGTAPAGTAEADPVPARHPGGGDEG